MGHYRQCFFSAVLAAGLLPVSAGLYARDGTDSAFGEEDVSNDLSVSQTTQADGLEGFNRSVFEFNELLDKLILKPVAEGYEEVAPPAVNRSVTNFFSNIGELPSIVNALLQGKPLVAGDNLFRFLVNSTAGVFGLFDVATRIGIDDQKEDFGQTLGTWGVPSGPYLVLPFLGPSTFRDAPAKIGDAAMDPISYVDSFPAYMAARTTDIVDTRADLLKAEKLITGDRYIFLKNAYLQRREYQIKDGQVLDDFDNSEFENDNWLEE